MDARGCARSNARITVHTIVHASARIIDLVPIGVTALFAALFAARLLSGSAPAYYLPARRSLCSTSTTGCEGQQGPTWCWIRCTWRCGTCRWVGVLPTYSQDDSRCVCGDASGTICLQNLSVAVASRPLPPSRGSSQYANALSGRRSALHPPPPPLALTNSQQLLPSTSSSEAPHNVRELDTCSSGLLI